MITRRSARLAAKATCDIETAGKSGKSERAARDTPDQNETPKITRKASKVPSKEVEPLSKARKTSRPRTDKIEPPKKRRKFARVPIKFEPISDPIVDDLRKQATSDESRDLESEILDQISLEGLTGIHYRRLLNLLDALYPNLKPLESENAQDYIFQVIIKRYLDPDTAIVKAYYNTKKVLDDESNSKGSIIFDKPIKLPKETSDRLKISGGLVLHPVQDGHIKGSCECYKSRVDITQNILDISEGVEARECIETVNAKYGIDNVFFVASQRIRFGALVANWVDPNMDIKLREYCTLELIGRSRTLGIVFPNDKQFGRYRILLLAKALICQYQETCSTFVIQHLIRFSPGKKMDSFKSIIPKPKVKSIQDSEIDEFETPDCIMKNICCNPNRLKIDRDFMKMIYDFIALSENGCTQLDIRKKFRLPKFHIRNHLKNMIALEWIHGKTDKTGDRPLRVYRTVHKSCRRRMLMKEKIVKPSRGVMASWDDKDLSAKKILGQKRSSFTRTEDSFLILCRITSLLLEPNLRKLSFCVNKKVIRDLMHEELIESRDKTSDACLRRMKYLRRLPSNIISIDELTAELRDDSDILNLVIAKKKLLNNEDKMNKLFSHLLKTVRIKIPYLLGMHNTTSSHPFCSNGSILISNRQSNKLNRFSITSTGSESRDKRLIEIASYKDLKEAYDIIDCVASSTTTTTGSKAASSTSGKLRTRRKQVVTKQLQQRHQHNCPKEQMPLSNRQLSSRRTVFLLNRYQSSSLMQLAHPINAKEPIELNESNEISSIAMLTSLCAYSSFEFDLQLRIPINVVDRSNESYKELCARANLSDALIVQPCSVRIRSKEDRSLAIPETSLDIEERLAAGSSQRKPCNRVDPAIEYKPTTAATATTTTSRVWKTIDGRVHIETLTKLIEALLSWIIMFPGIEFSLIQREFGHLMPREHLLELLDLIKDLELISVDKFEHGLAEDAYTKSKPCLFGKTRRRPHPSQQASQVTYTYEPKAGAFIKYCQLLERYINQIDDQVDGSHI